ncbi:hypothetical protein BAUCODRAFT_295361 [Baudoinia panamericana UAMH 10762]|uniref:ZZ-type domain-containing protein n=1 Tax=Baudoinia panamericana (strain UAMH 10762) TaxID=717646 RepID=M2MME8_BAUPA|nr:uncharacterized protein BAUCODRAFT_295361 [Baudoinia panamericana UAMH 10762]EMC92548.1 hypothetical protein BAUCODRAFT_295361 [Baudoinia panamericana UAMH 10762]
MKKRLTRNSVTCEECSSPIAKDDVRYDCTTCPNATFCENCYLTAKRRKRKPKGHVTHVFLQQDPKTGKEELPLKPARYKREAKQDVRRGDGVSGEEKAVQAMPDAMDDSNDLITTNKTIDLAGPIETNKSADSGNAPAQNLAAELPESLIHLERAQLFYARANHPIRGVKGRITQPGPQKGRIATLSAFKAKHYAATQLRASSDDLIRSGKLLEEVLRKETRAAPLHSPVSMTEPRVANLEKQVASSVARSVSVRLAGHEIVKALQALVGEGRENVGTQLAELASSALGFSIDDEDQDA